MAEVLDADSLRAALASLDGWTGDAGGISRTVEMPSFPAAIAVVDRVAAVAEEMNHHPDIDIRWRTTRWLLTTHDAGGLTQLDIEQAHRIIEIARRHGAGVDA